MDIQKVFVMGSGAMGSGIAQVCAQKGISVVMCDLKRDVLDRAVERINWSVSKFVEKGKVSEDLGTIMGRIETSVCCCWRQDHLGLQHLSHSHYTDRLCDPSTRKFCGPSFL